MASAPLPVYLSCSRPSVLPPPAVVLPQKFDRTKRRVASCQYSCFEIKDLSYQLPGTKINLLHGVSLSLREKSFGLIFGRSGSGKTTLLQLIAGLSKPTSGSICIQRYGDGGYPNKSPELLHPERVGIVFQFPERYFVAENVLNEVTFGWPRQRSGLQLKALLALRLEKAIASVGLTGVALDIDPHSLSGGYKRRLALAIQLVQAPDLLLLDEPLAGLGEAGKQVDEDITGQSLLAMTIQTLSDPCVGDLVVALHSGCALDWKARADVVKLLKHLKKDLTLLVVSHDLNELSALVDQSWRMEMGGTLKSEPPPV